MQHDLAVCVQHVQIGFDRAAVGGGDPRQAVPGVAAGAEPAQPCHTQRQQQPAVGAAGGLKVGGHRLETGVQQRRMDAVAGLLGADAPGSAISARGGGVAPGRVRGDGAR